MTYLQLVNKVLIRLREEEVSTVGENSYSALVGEFVNDAQRTVEDAWDWSALRTTLTVNTVAGVFNYTLTGSQDRIKVLDVVNDTDNFFMTYKSSHDFNNLFLNSDVPQSVPRWFSWNGVDGAGDSAVDIYPIPNGVFDLRFNVVLRSGELSADADVVPVSNMAIIQLATAFAARERGETGGTSAQELFSIADNTLSDAIALDAARHGEENIWYYV
tara:strand:- start:1196 stop:1843 length:648 start_codon:yes stop_codon:yes gene_type:complete